MATQLQQDDFRSVGGNVVRTAYEQFSAAGTMGWTRFEDTNVIAQVSGTATSAIGVVERSALDPAINANYAALADPNGFNADLTTASTGNVYVESGVGWWRIRMTTVTGGTAYCALSGQGG